MDLVAISKRAGEREPHLRAKARALLPGEGWREETSEGGQRAHDAVLPKYRERAGEEGWKERAHAARSIEGRRYKIRVRGYDRKYGKYGPSHQEGKDVEKSDGLAVIAKAYGSYDQVLAVRISADELDEIAKAGFFGALKETAKPLGRYARGFLNAGDDAVRNSTGFRDAIKTQYQNAGGWQGARQAVDDTAMEAMTNPSLSGKQLAALGGGAAAVTGAGLAGRFALKRAGAAKQALKGKGKKLALYGAGGAAGTVAAGTAIGNTVSPR